MRTIKRTFVVTLIVLCSTIFAVVSAFLLIDDATMVSYLIKHLEAATTTRIDYAKDASISRAYAPTLMLKELVIDDVEERFRVKTQSLLFQISLPKLLLGQLDVLRLWVGDTHINIRQLSAQDKEVSAVEDTQAILELLTLPLSPNLRDVQISKFSVLSEDGKWVVPSSQLNMVSLQLDRGEDLLKFSAQVEAKGETLKLNAALADIQKVQLQKQLPFTISAAGAGVDASVIGKVDLSASTPLVQANMQMHIPNLQTVAQLTDLDIPGVVSAKARLSGSIEQLNLNNLSLNWNDSERSWVKLDGRIGNIVDAKEIELRLTSQLDNPAWLVPLLPETIGSLSTVEMTAQISGQHSQLKLRQCRLKVKTLEQLDLSLTGQFDLVDLLSAPKPENIDLKLAFSAPTTRAARALLFDTIPEFGAIHGSTEISSTRGDPATENIVVRAEDPQGIAVDLKGRIGQFPLNPDKPNKGYHLEVRMQATKTSVMAERLGFELPVKGPLDLNYRIEGDTQALQLNQISLSAGHKRKTQLKAKGHILFREWTQEDPLQALDLTLNWRAGDTELLDAWIKQDLAYTVHARLHTVSGQHRIDDFRFKTAPGEALFVSDTGYAERITFLPQFSIEGIHVKTHMRSDDVTTLSKYLNLNNKIPAIGPLELRTKISGTHKKLLIDNVVLKAGRNSGLQLEAKGSLGTISAEKDWRLVDTNLVVNARSTNIQPIAQLLGYRLPPLGPMRMQANINDKHKMLGVDNIQLLIGDGVQPVLRSEGRIGDLSTLSKVHIVTTLNLGGEKFAAFADEHALPTLGALTGRMVISDWNGSLGIESLYIESTSKDLFNLYVNGEFDDFNRLETLAIYVRLSARDMKLIGALLDQDWPDHGPIKLVGKITTTKKKTAFNAILTSGKVKIDIVLSGAMHKTPPHITGKITAVNFYVPDLFEVESKKRAQRQRADKQFTEKGAVFSRTSINLDLFKAVDLDLAIEIQSFDRAHSEAESAQATISLKSGHLSVRPARLVYPKGEATLDLQVATKDAIQASFLFRGENLDPWRGLNIFEPDPKSFYKAKDAQLDVNISLRSQGENPHQLASNLGGQFYAAIRNGKISQSKLQLLFVDIIGWASKRKRQRYDDVNCGVMDFTVQQGVVTTNAFFMDMTNITIAGEGTIDLDQEQIDFVLIPKKKNRLIVKAEPVDVKGPLNDPKITAIPVKSLAVQTGKFSTLLFAPYVFAGIVAGQYATGRAQNKGRDASVCLEYLKTRQKTHHSRG